MDKPELKHKENLPKPKEVPYVMVRLWTCAALHSDPMGKRSIMMCGNLLSWMSLLKCGHKEQLSGRTEMYIHTIEE